MAKIKNLNDAIVREPEAADTEIQRTGLSGKDDGPAPHAPKTAYAPPKDKSPLPEPFPGRQSDARPVAGKTPRPTDKPRE